MQLTDQAEDGTLPATVSAVEDLGNYKIVRVKLGPEELAIKLPEEQPVPSEHAFVGFPAALDQDLRRRPAGGVVV